MSPIPAGEGAADRCWLPNWLPSAAGPAVAVATSGQASAEAVLECPERRGAGSQLHRGSFTVGLPVVVICEVRVSRATN
jgi:hypothetical protein